MENHKVFLPKLKKIRIVNYSLYSEDINYDFIDGLNLIVGGNGVGKTTFINILRYALIGLYKKELDVKVYKGEKRLVRGRYANSDYFFRNRTKQIDSDKNGYVELEFEINETLFYVKRSLYEIVLQEAHFTKRSNDIYFQYAKCCKGCYKKYVKPAKKDEVFAKKIRTDFKLDI